jgi:YD repeat-containing protein
VQRARKLLVLVCVLALVFTMVGMAPAVASPARSNGVPAAPAKAAAKPADPLRSERAAAIRAARRSGHRVEIVGLRGQSATTWANPNGTLTTHLSTGPERVKTGAGWRDIDPTLVRDSGGMHPKVVVGAMRLSAGGDRALVRATLPGGQRLGLDWPGVLPSPVLRGDTASYPGVVAGGDLVVQALPGGFELSLVLRQRPAGGVLQAIRLPLSGDAGVGVDAARGGGLRVWDAAGKLLAAGPPPVMFGAALDRNGLPARQAGLKMTVESPGAGASAAALVLAPDPGFLADPAVAYPVTIDPTVSWLPASDTYIQASNPTTNYNGATALFTGTSTTGSDKARSLLTFNASSLAGAQILSATMHAYNYQSSVCTSTSANKLEVHQITSGWNPAAITWSSGVPTWSNTVAASSTNSYAGTTACPGHYIDLNITSVVASWASGSAGNWGVLLKAQDETQSSGLRRFWATDHGSARPSLDVTYTFDAPVLQDPPRLVNANGAWLEWSRYQGLDGLPFDHYEVHRGTTAGFTPSSSTLLTTIRDQDTTTWRDTTAAPSPSATEPRTFYYKVVANTWVSNELTVVMPVAETARLTLQPDPAAGKATYMALDRTTPSGCSGSDNYGAAANLRVGTAANGVVHRPLLAFDVRDLPDLLRQSTGGPFSPVISSATLTLWYPSSTAPTTTAGREIKLHRVTRAWTEGTADYPGQCDGSGAAWSETQGGVRWSVAGGDFDATADATVGPKSHSTANGLPGSDAFTVTSLVQEWVSGTAPNHGVLLKLGNDATIPTDNPYFDYYSDDADASLRPRLTVTLTGMANYPQGPTVSLLEPLSGATVGGTAVRLAARATDDRRVDKVEFLVDGVVKATDTTTPFEATWDSTTATKGTHTVTARATDDVGNVADTQLGVSVIVDNTAGPTGSLTAPAAGAVVSGSAVTLSANATGNGDAVKQVEFLVDGAGVGVPDTTSPYSVAWNTLDPLAPAFDGDHQVQALITETSGQQFRTPATTVTVDNRASGQYKAKLELNVSNTDPTDDGVVPQLMTESGSASLPLQDPYAGTTKPDGTSGGSLGRSITDAPHVDTTASSCPADAYCPTVRITNQSGVNWNNSSGLDLRVWYRWYAPNGAILLEGPAADNFPNNFPAGAVKDFPLVIQPPRLPPGAELGAYRLRIDLYDVATASWYAGNGNPPIDRPILVAKRLDDRLGLERFWHYDGEAAGAGMTTLANIANGNMLLHWTPFFAPGRGLATMLDLTYNSLEDHSQSPAGNNFSLAISGLTRLGEPLDIHPNKADDVSNHSNNKFVELVDGDGTVHRFDGTTQPDGSTRWTEPAGVNLYLRSIDSNPDSRHWALTRPDKVTFYYDVDGFPTAVVDRNGNTLSFTLEDTPAGEDPGGPKKRITKVTDAAGMAGAPNRDFTVDYWTKDENKKAHVRGKIQRITDHDGSALDFDYYDDGNLLRLTQRGGTTANGPAAPNRSFIFTYTTPSGDQPAISDPTLRANPDPKTASQSTRLFSVRDPRGPEDGTPGRGETTFTYYAPSNGDQLRWKLKSRTNRAGKQTSFGYDLVNQVTTVTAPLSRVTGYAYDTDGKVTTITNPLDQPTQVQWTSDFKVAKVTEPKGVATPTVPDDYTTTYTYNANGYLTSRQNQITERVERTELTYTDSPVDAADVGNHLSLLATVTTPKGVATPTAGDFQWRYTYDPAGNPDTVTDPTDAVTDYDYNLAGSANPGTIAKVTDPNGNNTTSDPTDGITTFPSYDPSGQPTELRDPLGNSTKLGYDPDGHLIWIQDPNHASDTGDPREFRTFFDYDPFGRLVQQSTPKSTRFERGQVIVSSVQYDQNDNVVETSDPRFDHEPVIPRSLGVEGPLGWMVVYDAMDRPTQFSDQERDRTDLVYDDAGRLSRQIADKGDRSTTVDDFTTLVAYDPLDRPIRQTQYGTGTTDKRITHSCYDTAGDLRSVTAPRAGLDTVTCPGTGPLTGVGFTSTFDYDPAHRQVASRDPLGHETRTGYDANGNIASTEQDITTGRVAKTTTDYDQRDAPISITQRLDGATNRNVVSRIEYDPNGNRTRLISPRANDAAGGTAPFTNYVTAFTYDAANRLTRITLPFDGQDGTERQYVHRAYDAAGNLAWSSLPVTAADPASVQDSARTLLTYFDPGWIRSLDDPANPKVRFDYTAKGQQAERTPERKDAPGILDTSKRMTWTYFDDGLLETRTDQDGQSVAYGYDGNHNLTSALNASGLTDPGEQPITTEISYTGFDEPAKTRSRKQGAANWTFSTATYDPDGHIATRAENGEETDAGTQTKAPRSYQHTYDGADRLTQQLDLGTDGACAGDQRIVTSYFDTGWQHDREVRRGATGCTNPDPLSWPKKQTTTWSQFDNGLLRTLDTVNGSGETTESHTVGYTDDTGIFVNGNRTTDRYVLKRGQPSTATTCLSPTAPCDAKYVYDARDRLISHQLRAGKTNTYTYDQPAQLIGDTTIRAGNLTTQVEGGVTTTRRYTAQQLTEQTSGGATGKYWYDTLGNLDCVTTAAGSQVDCSPSDGTSASANLVADNAYDYLNRLSGIRYFAAGSRTDKTDYTYDALDRLTKEVEDHAGTAKDRTTTNTFQGLTNLVTQEQQTGGSDPKTKTYAYDTWGHRLSLTDTNSTGTTNTYSYGSDVHGSVSQLIDDAGNVKASYGYTAYGGTDATDSESLTSGDPDPQAPLNPYRYTSRRIDSGTAPSTTPAVASGAGGYDMGARRYGPDIGAFLQQDQFDSALADLGLALDPLTQNRYALAGGNPISYVEWDGHAPTRDNMVSANPALNVEWNATSPSGGNAAEYAASREAGASPSGSSGGSSGLPPILGWATSGARAVTSTAAELEGAAVAGALIVLGIGGIALGGDTEQGAGPDQKDDPAKDCLSQPIAAPSTVENLPMRHGRATGGEACYGADGRAVVDPRPPATPQGFQEGVGLQRGHLIPRAYRGSADVKNIVPMYEKTNLSGMKKIENRLGRRIASGQSRVYYSIKVDYIPYTDIPAGFRYYIKSYYMSPITHQLEPNVDTGFVPNVPVVSPPG